MKPISVLTRGAMAALTLLLAGTTACTDSHDLPTEGNTPTQGIVSTLAPKPGYTSLPAATRTTDEGSWQTGDEVKATITFYAEGKKPVATNDDGTPAQPVEQTLTYTAPVAPATEGSWAASPAIVFIAPAACSMRVAYAYNAQPDPLTKTSEQITGYVTKAVGTAVGGEVVFESTDPTDDRLIPITNVTGTLTLSIAFERRSGLVSVVLQPGQKVVLTTPAAQPGIKPDDNKGYLLSAENDSEAPATAHFHLTAPLATEADATTTTFTLRLAGEEKTAYKDVPLCARWMYTLDAGNINGVGGGGNQQFITADGLEPLDPNVFNANIPVWIITGGASPDEANKVATNVRNALQALPEGTIELMLANVTALPIGAFSGYTALRSVSLPLATDIGSTAFSGCTALTTVSLPLAKSIGSTAFGGCEKLTTVSLPEATGIGSTAFGGCTALTRLELSAAGSFTLDPLAFGSFDNSSACTLLLHHDKKPGGTGTPKVDGNKWGTKDTDGTPAVWLKIDYLGTNLPGLGDGGKPY